MGLFNKKKTTVNGAMVTYPFTFHITLADGSETECLVPFMYVPEWGGLPPDDQAQLYANRLIKEGCKVPDKDEVQRVQKVTWICHGREADIIEVMKEN